MSIKNYGLLSKPIVIINTIQSYKEKVTKQKSSNHISKCIEVIGALILI